MKTFKERWFPSSGLPPVTLRYSDLMTEGFKEQVSGVEGVRAEHL